MIQLLSLLDSKRGAALIQSLLKSQMPSGGFPSKFDNKIEGTKETCRNTLLLLKCGIPQDGLNVRAAIDYLIRTQRPDGGWSENRQLTIPKQVVELTNKRSITWLTADIVELLREAGLTKVKSYSKALSWLRKMQNRDGGWPMFRRDVLKTDPDSTAQILFIMREIYAENDPAWLKGFKLFESYLDKAAKDAEQGWYIDPSGNKMGNDIYTLTHLLLSSLVDSNLRIRAGYDLKDKRVRKVVTAILKSQHRDGGWRPFWSSKSDPTYTVLALKLFISLGVLDEKRLRSQAKAYVED